MSELQELTSKQKLLGNVISIIILLSALTFLVLCSLGVVPLEMGDVVLPVSLGAVALVCLSSAIVQKNPVSLWLATAFALPALISLSASYTALGYDKLYPLYIATPGIGCVVAMIFARSRLSLLKAALVFLIAGAIFALGSFEILPMLWVWIAFTVYALALIAFVIVYMSRGERK